MVTDKSTDKLTDKSSEECEQELKKIRSLCNHFLRSIRTIDVDSLVMDIWLELWIKDGEPSWLHVRNRCIDAIRKLSSRRERTGVDLEFIVDKSIKRVEDDKEDQLDRIEAVNRIMECPFLSTQQRQLVFLRFYRRLTGREIGKEMGFSKVQVNRRLVEVLKVLKEWVFLTGVKTTVKESRDERTRN